MMQKAFARALKEPAPPSGLISHNGSDPGQRFAIYRNNVTVALLGNIETRFPTLRQLLGEDNFIAVAREFIATHPPQSPLMHLYGGAFPSFIAEQKSLAELPYLSDVARLDFAQGEVFYAPDFPDLDPAQLATLTPDDLPNLRFVLKKSWAVIYSDHPIYSIWAAHHGSKDFSEIDLAQAETVLVLRKDDEILLLPCASDAARVIEALNNGKTLGQLAQENVPPQILQEVLGQLLSLSLISSFKKEI